MEFYENKQEPEKAVLIAVDTGDYDCESSLDELEELAKMVIERASSASGIKKIPYEQAYEPGFEDMLNRAPDCSAIRELTSWEPQITLEEIIDDVVAYTRDKMKQS